MGCNCGKNKAAAGAAGTSGGGTFKVNVSGRQVYESSNLDAARTVAGRYPSAEIVDPTGAVISA